MKIKITHSTTYKYSSMVPRLVQCLKLYPSKCDNQEIIEWNTFSNCGKSKGRFVIGVFLNGLIFTNPNLPKADSK